QHAEEAGLDAPEAPTFFAKFPNALAAPGAEVKLPAYSEKVDYEAEVAFVIADRCKDVPESEALEHVLGYTLLNDLSARDYQFMTPQWGPGKTFDGSAPCGPAIVTAGDAGPHDAIEISLTLTGETMQSASTAPGTPVLVEYFGWIFISGRMWWTAWATAIAASAKPVAISFSFPSKVVMSPAAHTASIEVFITWSTLIEPFSTSRSQSLRGPSAVLKPSCSRT